MYDGTVGDFAGHIKTNVFPVLDGADPAKRIKLIVDEWGDWLVGDNWMQTPTLMDGLSAASHLHLMMGHCDRIAVACLAQGINVIHSLLNISTSNVMIRTPTFYVFKMFKPHHEHGAKWVPITSPTIQTTTQSTAVSGSVDLPVLTVGSTVDTNGRVNISVNNIDLNASRQITINLTSNQPQYILDSAQIVTGPAMNSNNPFGGAETVNLQNFAASNFTLTNSGKTLTATLPARSIVMFRLKTPPPTSLQNGSLPNSTPDVFSIKSGLRGSVLITSSMSQKTPITVSLHSIDGRSLGESFALASGKSSFVWRPKNRHLGTNVYVVKIRAGECIRSQRIIF
jgi:alpha-L-arabinofuranosidase